jgi:hypothetical protein
VYRGFFGSRPPDSLARRGAKTEYFRRPKSSSTPSIENAADEVRQAFRRGRGARVDGGVMIRSMGVGRGRVNLTGSDRVAEDRSTEAPESRDWDATVEISQYILTVELDGHSEIFLQTAERRGAGVARLSFRAPLEGFPISLIPGSGTDAWPSDGSLDWVLPAAAFDAVLAILRDGDSPNLHAFRRQGQLHCTLTAQTKTRPVT